MDYTEIEKVTSRVKEVHGTVETLRRGISETVIGQRNIVDRLLITFLAGGHLLLEGMPGLAKTMLIRTFAKLLDTGFTRVQFTPDLLPADLLGTRIYNPKDLDFFTRKGPVFTNLLLADEINRAPAKVQSALLQAMEEHQVTIGDETHLLPEPFMVMATENPIEQEGTYPLPEAQLDRFFMKVLVTYPSYDEELSIVRGHDSRNVDNITSVMSVLELASLRELVKDIYIDETLTEYIVRIVHETRKPSRKELKRFVEFGASPRASISLMAASRGMAFLRGRGFVTPEDIKEVAPDILRHRLVLSYEADAEEHGADEIIETLLSTVEVP